MVGIMRSNIICFFGPDGAGKTTISKYLNAYLHYQGIRSKRMWIRGTHSLASILAKILSNFNVYKGPCNPYYRICIPSKMKPLWLWLEFISVLPVILIRLAIPKLFRRYIIAERSLIDFLIWLIVTLRQNSIIKSSISKIILSLEYSLCDKIIYIYADIDVLLHRRKNSGDKLLIPLIFNIYNNISKIPNILYINTSNKPIIESVQEILKLMGVNHDYFQRNL